VNRLGADQTDTPVNLARPVIKKMRWPRFAVWLAPALALVVAGGYLYDYFELRGPQFTITFHDAGGLKPGETKVMHLGVDIGVVSTVELSSDHNQAVVTVRLQRWARDFGREGASFWVVRPEISMQEISGLATVLSGPYIDTIPGTGEIQSEFSGLDKRPVSLDPGLRITLKSPRVDRITADSPVYFRGVAVGIIQSIQVDGEGDAVDMGILIQQRFAPLVRKNSKFWVISGVDVKGGLLTGMQMKVESIRTLISGGVGFATPDNDMGDPAQNGDVFPVYDDSKDEWLGWDPKIPISADGTSLAGTTVPSAAQSIRSTVTGQ
jgi:paraquat-inducible protein B